MSRSYGHASVGMSILLLAGAAMGQQTGSLAESYATLCATGEARTTETCVALSKALADKAAPIALRDAVAQPHLDRATWGLYADLIGKTMSVGDPGAPVFAKVAYAFVNGKVLETWTWYGTGAHATSDVFTIEHLADRGQLRMTSSAGTAWLGKAGGDGALVFSKGSIVGKSVMGYYPSPTGIERRTSYRGQNTVEPLSAFDDSKEAGYRDMAAQNREQERREKAAAAEARLQVLGAVVNGVAQGYAEHQAQEASSESVGPRVASRAGSSVHASATSGRLNGPQGDAAGGPGHRATTEPLRFVLSISLAPKAGDRVNPTCYSGVITRPGPPGWGASGSLPQGSQEQAHSVVHRLKPAFIAACRASGRDVTSEGDFRWVWNQYKDGEGQIAASRAQYPEDVTVNVD